MAEDTVSDVEDVEQTGSADTDEVLLLVFLALGIVFILAIVFDYKSLAGLGVGEIGSFLAPVQAFFNGLANLITGFFNGLAHAASNLFISPALYHTPSLIQSWEPVPIAVPG